MNINNILNKLQIIIALGVIIVFGAQKAYAANSGAAKVSFTFDDGYLNSLTEAAPTLAKYGIKATIYVPTGCINNTGNCRSNVDPQEKYMTWNQVKRLQDTYGWEIAGHTKNHRPLTTLSNSARMKEISDPLAQFAQRGIKISNIASPEGDYDYLTLSYMAKYYSSHRGFWDQNVNRWPYNDYILNVKQVQAGVSVSEVKQAVDQAIANKEWLILVFHGIKPNPSNDVMEYEYGTSQLNSIAGYVSAKVNAGNIQAVTIKQGLVVTETNILPNNSFSEGISNGWSTDNTQSVTIDTNNNGSYPSAVESLRFTGNGKAAHVFTPKIPAINGSTYAFKAFVNTLYKSGGEFGYYIDEYDTNGNWISGRWLGAVWLPTVSYFTSFYTPSSADVRTFSVQTYFSGNPNGVVYADNYQLYNITTDQGVVSPTPVPVTPTLTPTQIIPSPTLTLIPTPTIGITLTPTLIPSPTGTEVINLVSNYSFEEYSDNWAVDWLTDNTYFTLDFGSQGNHGTNSLHLLSNSAVSHVFSKQISVEYGSEYSWKQYINTVTGNGEFGFYIDEYDANGNWISGQWKGMLDNPFSGIKEFSYTPTSSNVKSVRLQYYVTANSSFDLILDSVMFIK